MASYVRGIYASAACGLLDELRRRGVRGAVGYVSRKRDRTLIVQTSDPTDAIPTEWQGFRVKVERPFQRSEDDTSKGE